MLFNTQLTTRQRLDRAVSEIMSHPRYTVIAGIFMIGEREIVEGIPTAATNGRDEFYGKKFVDEMLARDSDLRFVVLHEVTHKTRRHLLHYQWMYELDADIANQACDHAINLSIINENIDKFVTMPMKDGKPLGLCDARFTGMDEAQIFHILYDEKRKNGGNGGNGASQPSNAMDEHDWEGAKDLSAEEQQQLVKDIDDALRQGMLNAAKQGHNTNPLGIADLLQVEVDYRDIMREFLTETLKGGDDATWRVLSRKYLAADILRPSRIDEAMQDVVFAIDTSGSTFTQGQLTKFMSEVVGMLEAVTVKRVHVMYWDTKVAQVEVYGEEYTPISELASTTRPAGGGGTDVKCVTQYLKDHNITAQAAVVLTDGDLSGGWGTWDMPVLWAVLNNKKVRPTTGRTVHINL